MKELVPKTAGVIQAQLAVVFPEGNKRAGKPKIIFRMGWALTRLKKVGAVENPERGVWEITEVGYRYLAMESAEAMRSLDEAYKEVMGNRRFQKT